MHYNKIRFFIAAHYCNQGLFLYGILCQELMQNDVNSLMLSRFAT